MLGNLEENFERWVVEFVIFMIEEYQESRKEIENFIVEWEGKKSCY